MHLWGLNSSQDQPLLKISGYLFEITRSPKIAFNSVNVFSGSVWPYSILLKDEMLKLWWIFHLWEHFPLQHFLIAHSSNILIDKNGTNNAFWTEHSLYSQVLRMKGLRVILMQIFVCPNVAILFANIAFQPEMCLIAEPNVRKVLSVTIKIHANCLSKTNTQCDQVFFLSVRQISVVKSPKIASLWEFLKTV